MSTSNFYFIVHDHVVWYRVEHTYLCDHRRHSRMNVYQLSLVGHTFLRVHSGHAGMNVLHIDRRIGDFIKLKQHTIG